MVIVATVVFVPVGTTVADLLGGRVVGVEVVPDGVEGPVVGTAASVETAFLTCAAVTVVGGADGDGMDVPGPVPDEAVAEVVAVVGFAVVPLAPPPVGPDVIAEVVGAAVVDTGSVEIEPAGPPTVVLVVALTDDVGAPVVAVEPGADVGV